MPWKRRIIYLFLYEIKSTGLGKAKKNFNPTWNKVL
jgi:hypothetical protein